MHYDDERYGALGAINGCEGGPLNAVIDPPRTSANTASFTVTTSGGEGTPEPLDPDEPDEDDVDEALEETFPASDPISP